MAARLAAGALILLLALGPAQANGGWAAVLKVLDGDTLRVRLESDPRQPRRDAYGRLLAHLHLADGRLLSAVLVRLSQARHSQSSSGKASGKRRPQA